MAPDSNLIVNLKFMNGLIDVANEVDPSAEKAKVVGGIYRSSDG